MTDLEKIVQEGMDKSYLQGKIIVLHDLINRMKQQVIKLEEELEKGKFSASKRKNKSKHQ